MAAELGLDVAVAKRAGLLHDIGKAVNHEIEGPHALVGADIVKRYGESDDVVNGVASHHGEAPQTGLYGILVSAADAISASRPGARSETVMTYIRRVEDLERIGTVLSWSGEMFCAPGGPGIAGPGDAQPGERRAGFFHGAEYRAQDRGRITVSGPYPRDHCARNPLRGIRQIKATLLNALG